MKLMDKIKNLFLDEEEYEVEDEENFPQYEVKDKEKENKEIKKASKDELPKVMQETIKKEEKIELKVNPNEYVKDEKKIEEVKEQPKKFNFPIDFNDDFLSENNRPIFDEDISTVKNVRNNNINVLKIDKQVTQKVTEMYSHRDEEKVKPKFKASPVISPVYGVLDKNYKKDEVKEKSEALVEMKRPSKKVDFETVRKKAFGNLTDEIKDNMLCENCELYKEVKRINSLKEDDLLYDMTVDDAKEKTIEKAYDDYEEFGVVYEPKKEKDIALEHIEEENEDVSETVNNVEYEEDSSVDKIERIKEEILGNKSNEEEEKVPSREDKKKDIKVDADFFELIDSMYKERVDDGDE